MSWFVVVNPGAGRGASPAAEVTTMIAARGVDAEIVESTSPEDLARLVDGAVSTGFRRFVAVGGDGTMHLIVDALMRHSWGEPPQLAIIPAGSGSDFIRTFGFSRDRAMAVERLATGTPYRVDVGVVEGNFGTRYFLNAMNAGIAAASVPAGVRLPARLGTFRYNLGFWMVLPRFPAVPIRLTAGSRTWEGTAINVVVANGQFFGGGMNVAPKAILLDGRFDIQVFTGPRRQAFTLMPRVVRGLHLGHPGVQRFSAGEFTIGVPDDWPVEADGEVLGAGPVQGRALPGALDFTV